MASDAEAAISQPAMAAEPIVPMAEATELKAEAAEATAGIADPSPEADQALKPPRPTTTRCST